MSSPQQVGVEFTGSSTGAVGAARSTASAIKGVREEANTLNPALNRTEQSIGRASRGALAGSGMFRGLGRSVAFASTAFLGGYGLVAALRGAGDELVNQVKWNAQARAAIHSTGGVAGVTAKMIDQLAAAEMRKTGADDEQIKAAEVMLLRYTKVRDVVGEGNNIFARATRMSLDLSAALGTDAPSAARQLGKALNDPVRGLTQLRRVGAAFTTEESDRIKKLAEEGKTLEAQKAILDTLARSYGGTAKAVSDVQPWMRLKETLKNLSAAALKPLLPEIDSLVGRVQKWADGLEKNRAEQQRLKNDVEQGAHAVGDIASAVNKAAGVMGGWGNVVKALIAYKVASTFIGWTGALKAFGGAAFPAGQRTAALLTNMKALARIGTLTLGVDLLFQSKGQGSKGLIGALLTGAAIGSKFGPWGALLGGAAALTIDVFVQRGSSQGQSYDPAQGPNQGAALAAAGAKAALVRAGMTADQLNAQGHYEINQGNKQLGEALLKLSYLLAKEGAGARLSKQQASAFNRQHPQGGAALTSIATNIGTASGFTYGENLQNLGLPPAPGRSQILDCSSYVYEVFTAAGFKKFPDVSTTQWGTKSAANWTSEVVPVGDASPGDVVFYNVPGGEGAYPNHVGVVVSGKGRNAQVMQYTSRGKRAAVYGIIASYPIQGVKRFYLVKGSSKTGAASPDTGPVASSSKSTVAAVTGSNLIPIGLRGAIGHAANMATTTKGLVAVRWLHTEITDLEHARQLLEDKLKTASGKQRAAIQLEIQSIDASIARTQKSVAGAIAGWAKGYLSTLEKRYDAQFQRQTAAHIANVLAPRYFQGVDAQGNQRLTPAEAALQAMQAQDTATQLQQALVQAQQSGDPAQIAAAQRAIQENQLSIQATAERAKADADYAKAVARYQKDRDKLEAKLNASLSRFVDHLARGTAALGDLVKLLEGYGLGKGRRGKHTTTGGGSSGSGGGNSGAVYPLSTVGIIPAGLRMAGGGKVPGPTHVNADVVPAFLTPSETVLDRRLTDALERVFVDGQAGFGGVGDVYLDRQKVGRTIARPVADQQRRQISYTLQRG